jgi:hypothetical protein
MLLLGVEGGADKRAVNVSTETEGTGEDTKKLNSATLVRERTIPTERLPLVGEVSANFWRQRVSRGQRNGSLRPYYRISRPEPLLLLPSSSLIVLTRLSGPCFRPVTSQKIW